MSRGSWKPISGPALPRAPVNKWLVTLSVTFGTLMGAIDSSIVNVAVPQLRGALGATVEEITWITTGFVIATVLVMPLTAFLGRQFGQKRVYMTALVLFVLGSAMCGLARSLVTMVACRVIQGIGAGALQPTEQAILRQTFPPEEQGMAMAVFGLAVVLGPAFGPTLGGWIVDNYSWPWIFYINLPVGALALFMVQRFVHEPEDIRVANAAIAEQQRRNMDWLGIALMIVGLAAMQFTLEEGSRNDWFESRMIIAAFGVAVLGIAAFIVRELTAKVPVVDLMLFKDPVFMSGTLIGSVMFAMLLSITFLLPVFMEEMLGFTATQSGLAMMPRSLMMMVCMPIIGRLYNRLSPRVVVGFGIVLFAFSALVMSRYTLDTSASGVVGVLLIHGVSFSCLFIPLTTTALSRIPRHKLADAAGLNSLLRQIGGSTGLAIFASLINRYAVQAKAGLAAHLHPGTHEVTLRLWRISQGLIARGYDAASAQTAAGRVLAATVMRQALVLSFEKIFLMAGISFLAVMPLLLLFRTGRAAPVTAAQIHVEM